MGQAFVINRRGKRGQGKNVNKEYNQQLRHKFRA
jgi:hypothetical protein